MCCVRAAVWRACVCMCVCVCDDVCVVVFGVGARASVFVCEWRIFFIDIMKNLVGSCTTELLKHSNPIEIRRRHETNSDEDKQCLFTCTRSAYDSHRCMWMI